MLTTHSNRLTPESLSACYIIQKFMVTQITLNRRTEVLKSFSKDYDPQFFKSLSEPVRIKILEFLMMNGRSDIRTITEQMPQDRSVISRHLNQMQKVGILSCEKETQHVYYSINAQNFVDKLERFLNLVKAGIGVCCTTNEVLE